MARTLGRYRVPAGKFSAIQADAKTMWSKVKDPKSEVYKHAKQKGIAVDKLKGPMSASIQIKKANAGLIPGVVEALVMAGTAAGPYVAKAAWDTWKLVLLPYLRRKYGDKFKATPVPARKATKKK